VFGELQCKTGLLLKILALYSAKTRADFGVPVTEFERALSEIEQTPSEIAPPVPTSAHMITVTKTIARKYNLTNINTTVSNKNNRKGNSQSLCYLLRKELSYNYNTKQYLQSYANSIIIVTRYNY